MGDWTKNIKPRTKEEIKAAEERISDNPPVKSTATKPTNEKVTVKDQHENHTGYYNSLSSNLKGFIDDVYALDDGKFKGIRLTSGKRDKKEGDRDSKHHTGDAVDIAAWQNGGELGNELYSRLLNTRDGLAILNKHGLGIYDETDPAELKKTGGSGPHFHIGSDFGHRTKERLNQFSSGEVTPVVSFYASNPGFDYSNINESLNAMENANSYAPFKVSTTDPNLARTFVSEVKREAGKESKTEEKVSESDARKKIEKAKAEAFKAKMEREKEFLKAVSDFGKPDAPLKQPEQTPFKEEAYDFIKMQTSMPDLPSIHQLPDFNTFEFGGEQSMGGGDPEKPLTKKQIRERQYFTMLNGLRSNYKHLDPASNKWNTPGELNFGGDSIKGYSEKGFTPVTTKDYITWRVSNTDFTPDPTSFIDLGISDIKREDFETEDAYTAAYNSDRVVLAPNNHPKYGDMYVPIGTGASSQKLAEEFNKDFGTFYTKGKQIIPYYSMKESSPYEQSYEDWRKEQSDQFNSGLQEQRYGGVFQYENGGEASTKVKERVNRKGDKIKIVIEKQGDSSFVRTKTVTRDGKVIKKRVLTGEGAMDNYVPYTPEDRNMRMRNGGEVNSGNYIDLELTDEEIRRYEQGGYKIEYL